MRLPGIKLLWVHDRRLTQANKPALALPSGEPAKTFGSFRKVIDFLIENDDGSPLSLVAYGGGSIGDVVGFAASTYRRGIPFVQMPTTLLAMVDASVGGKTAINHPLAKNMVGTFHQPSVVIADLDLLRTLSPRQFRSGLAEVIKHGLIGDPKLFAMMEKNPEDFLRWDGAGIAIAVERSVRLKARIVMQDERETKGIREALNFGHTLGHALESYHGYRKHTHGEAISIGMAAALRLSEKLLGFSEVERAESLLEKIGLPVRLTGENAARLLDYTRRDKKRRTNALRMTLIESIGKIRVVDGIDERLLRKTIQEIGGR